MLPVIPVRAEPIRAAVDDVRHLLPASGWLSVRSESEIPRLQPWGTVNLVLVSRVGLRAEPSMINRFNRGSPVSHPPLSAEFVSRSRRAGSTTAISRYSVIYPAAAWRSICTASPRPGMLFSWIVPPSTVMRRCTIASPSPLLDVVSREGLVALGRCHSWSAVDDLQADAVVMLANRDGDLPVAGGHIQGVGQKVVENLLKIGRASRDAGLTAGC